MQQEYINILSHRNYTEEDRVFIYWYEGKMTREESILVDDIIQSDKGIIKEQHRTYKEIINTSTKKELLKMCDDKIQEHFDTQEHYRNRLKNNINEYEKYCIIKWMNGAVDEKCRWERFRRRLRKKGKQVLDIETAKQTLIEQIMPTQPISSTQDKRFYKCPLHNEKTGSFCIYRKTNTYYCFGCHQGGDVISLYQKLYNCNFSSAVKELS